MPKSARRWIAGHVDQRIVAGHYVYLRLRDTSGAETWLVSLSATTPTATDVRARVLGRAEHFHWRDDEAMLDFVVSPAHGAAAAAIGDLSRGGSIVTHWMGDETRATWEVAAQQLADDDGPFY